MMCVRFTEKYLEFARECIPTKTITIRDRDKPWFNSGIKREMKIISITSTNLQSQSSETRTGSSKVSIPEIMSILVGSLTKFVKLYNCKSLPESVSQRKQLQYATVINRGLILVLKEKWKFAILFLKKCVNSRILITYANNQIEKSDY
jgi:hypothetical protein